MPNYDTAIFGDTQIYSKGGSSDYLEHILKSLDNFYNLCISHNVKRIIHLGDLYEIKNEISDEVLVKTFNVFEKISKLVGKDNFYLIVGNHDTSRKDNSINLLEVFSPIAKIISTPFVEGDSVFIPFHKDDTIIKTYLKKAPKVKYCFGHFGVSGARYQKDSYTFATDLIASTDFKKFQHTFLGHYHFHQTLKNNVTFVGSSWQCNFGEEGETKGFVLLNSVSGEWDFFENNDFPKYITIELNKTNLKKINTLEKSFVKIVLNKKIDYELVAKLKKKLNEKNYLVLIDHAYNNIQNDKVGVLQDWQNVVQKTADDMIVDWTTTLFEMEEKFIIKDFEYTKEEMLGVIGL